jgi:hypothetical protein
VRGARRRRAALGLAALVVMAGCKGRATGPEARPPEPGEANGQLALSAACGGVLSSLGTVSPERRVARLLEACQPCQVGPLLVDRRGMKRTLTYMAELDSGVQACGGFCTQQARTDFLRALQAQLDDGEPSARPWRELAQACPAELGWREETRGFVGASWFLLERLARAAGGEMGGRLATATTAPFPLPAVAAEGRGLELPSVPFAQVPLLVPGRLVITVLAADLMVGRMPWGAVTATGVVVDGEYPGLRADKLPEAIAVAEAVLTTARVAPQASATAPSAMVAAPGATAAAGAAPSRPPPVPVLSIAAPRELPAARVAQLLGQLGRPARLLVEPASSLPEYQPPMALPPVLLHTAPNDLLRVSIADAAAMTAAVQQLRDRKVFVVTLLLEADTTVEQLAAALTQLHTASSIALVDAPIAAPAKAAARP